MSDTSVHVMLSQPTTSVTRIEETKLIHQLFHPSSSEARILAATLVYPTRILTAMLNFSMVKKHGHTNGHISHALVSVLPTRTALSTTAVQPPVLHCSLSLQ